MTSPQDPSTLPAPSPSAAKGQKLALEIMGWAGAALLLLGFYLNTQGALDAHGLPYLALNLAGSAGVGLNALAHRTWPAMAIEVAWFIIAAWGIGRVLMG